jgi:hypothetical protein
MVLRDVVKTARSIAHDAVRFPLRQPLPASRARAALRNVSEQATVLAEKSNPGQARPGLM